MAEDKNYPRMVLYLIQLFFLVLLLNAVESQTWYSGNLDLDYTEGLPAGTSMDIELSVDKESSDGKLEIGGFLTFMNWQTTRNDTTIPSEDVQADTEFEVKPLSEIQQMLPVLVKITISITIVLVILSYFHVNYRSILGIVNSSLALYILFTILILAPIGYLGDIDFTTGMVGQDEGESTVHQSFDGSPEIKIGENLELNYVFTIDGYDLGLVNTSQLTEVIENEPEENHRSYFKIEGKTGITYSAFVTEYLWVCVLVFISTPFFMTFRDWTKISKPKSLHD